MDMKDFYEKMYKEIPDIRKVHLVFITVGILLVMLALVSVQNGRHTLAFASVVLLLANAIARRIAVNMVIEMMENAEEAEEFRAMFSVYRTRLLATDSGHEINKIIKEVDLLCSKRDSDIWIQLLIYELACIDEQRITQRNAS